MTACPLQKDFQHSPSKHLPLRSKGEMSERSVGQRGSSLGTPPLVIRFDTQQFLNTLVACMPADDTVKKTLPHIVLAISIMLTLNLASHAGDSETIDASTDLSAVAPAKEEASAKVDSLNTIIQTAGHDTTKAKALLKLTEKLYTSNPDTAIQLSKRALQIYIENDIVQGIASAYNHIGAFYRIKSDYPAALKYHRKGVEIQESLGDKQGMAISYNNIGLIYTNQSSYPQALTYYYKSLKIKEELGNKQGIALTYNNIGIIYKKQSSYPQALSYYFKSLKIMEELGNKHAVASIYNNIGLIYTNQSSYPQALSYYYKSLKIYEEQGNKLGMTGSYTNIGSLYTTVYEQGDSLAKGVGDPIAIGWASDNPTQLLDTAMYYQQKALSIKEELSDEYGMSITLGGIGAIYVQKRKYAEALQHYHQAALLADSIGAMQEESDAHAGLAECYEKLAPLNPPAGGKYYRLALEHYKQYSTLKDSVFNEEKSKDLGKLEAKHEFEMAEQERKRQEEEQARILEEQTERRNLLQYSGILIFIVAFFITLLFSGQLNIPVRLAEGGVFFTFLLVFEFLLVLTDPYIEQYTGGEPAYKLMVNAGLAGLIFPLHSIAEAKLKQRLFKTRRLRIKKRRPVE